MLDLTWNSLSEEKHKKLLERSYSLILEKGSKKTITLTLETIFQLIEAGVTNLTIDGQTYDFAVVIAKNSSYLICEWLK